LYDNRRYQFCIYEYTIIVDIKMSERYTLINMSQSIHILCSDRPAECGAGYYVADVVFETCSWLGYEVDYDSKTLKLGPRSTGLTDIPVFPLDRDISFFCVNRMERRTKEEVNEGGCMMMTYAQHLKGIKLYEDEWHPTRIVWAKAIMSFIDSLDDNWVMFVWEV
jgi:hypothetical protein